MARAPAGQARGTHQEAWLTQVLANPRMLRASLALTRWLQVREHIATRDVIGHNESLTSPYHRERVARLRTQTHADWPRALMRRYRARLAGSR